MLRAIRRSFRKSKKNHAPPTTHLGAEVGQQDENVDIRERRSSAQRRRLSTRERSSLSSATSSSSSSTSLNSLMDGMGHLEVIEEVRSADAAVERSSLLSSRSVTSTTMPTVKSRSLPERFQHTTTTATTATAVDCHLTNSTATVADHNDSGFGVEIMGHHDKPRRVSMDIDRRKTHRLERQDEVMNSNSSGDEHSTGDVNGSRIPSPDSSFRNGRHRVALRSFRYRSEEFLRRTFRPSCVRPPSNVADNDDEVDMPYVPTAGLGDIVTGASPPSTGSLAVDASASLSSSSMKRNLRRRVALSRHFMRHAVAGSSSADIGSLIRESDVSSALVAAILNATSVGTGAGASTYLCHSLQSSNSDLANLPSSIEADVWVDRLNGDHESVQPSSSSSSSTTTTSTDLTRSIYRRALYSVVNPLGCPDKRPGFSCSELAHILRDVFQFTVEEHSSALEELKDYRSPNNVIVRINVLEARDLKIVGSSDSCGTYCVVALINDKSARASPNDSPRTSPTIGRRRSSRWSSSEQDDNTVHQTELAKVFGGTVRWDDQFEFEPIDLQNDELHVVVSTSGSSSGNGQQRGPPRRSSLKNLLKYLRFSTDGCRNNGNFLGQFRIPLSDIPTGGCEQSFSLFRDKKQRMPQPGSCRLRLQLAVKQSVEQTAMGDRLSEDRSAISDYHFIVKQFYVNALKEHCNEKNKSTMTEFERLPEQSRFILGQYALHNCVEQLTQCIIHLAVLLEMKSDSAWGSLVSEKHIKEELAFVRQECDKATAQFESDRKGSVSEHEKTVLDDSVSLYLKSILSNLSMKTSLPRLFPPLELQLEELNHFVGVAISLISLPIWSAKHDNSPARQEFTAYLVQNLQEQVRRWLQIQLDTVPQTVTDAILPTIKQFAALLREVNGVLTPIFSVSQYFSRLGLDYFKVASVACDTKLSAKAQELTMESDHYQVRFNKFGANIRESSIVTLEHYFALRTLFGTIRANVGERQLFRISISNYQEWFNGAITFWLQTFRDECMRRMEKALEIDKDVVQVTSLVKYSNSVVDVKSCFAKMTTEWREIDFGDADIALLGVTKITDTICDCVKLYLEKVINILESNGYYDYIDNQQFDVTDQLCITLNNISHMRGYLGELSSLLHWDIVAQQLSIKHESEDVGQMALRSLSNLVSATGDDVTAQSRILAQQITAKITVDLKKYTAPFAKCHDDQPNDVEPLLDYLENNLQVLYQKLDSTIYPLFLEEILKAEMLILLQYLEVGQSPSYYQSIHSHVKTIGDYFHSGGVKPCAVRGCKLYKQLMEILEINSMTSDHLMLKYYNSLTDNKHQTHVRDYYGDLVVKAGYKNDSEGSSTIFVNVVEARCLPGMSNNDQSCPFVSIELCPLTMFPVTTRNRTKVRPDTINPLFEEKFEFPNIMAEYRTLPGAVMIFSVWHHEALLPNVFLGEFVLPLTELRELTGRQTVDDVPVTMRRLVRPKEPRDGPYKVLKQRLANHDRLAYVLIEQRCRTVNFRSPWHLCRPMKTIVATITGRKLEVIGRNGSICIRSD